MDYITAFIATIVAIIAFMQWNTARQKIVLDLFEKRFEVYDQLRSVVARQAGIDEITTFSRAKHRASFLFRKEVEDFLETYRHDLIAINVEREAPKSVAPERQSAEYQRLVARADRMANFFAEFDKLVAPYMKHTQKHLRY